MARTLEVAAEFIAAHDPSGPATRSENYVAWRHLRVVTGALAALTARLATAEEAYSALLDSFHDARAALERAERERDAMQRRAEAAEADWRAAVEGQGAP